jgi:hypothetical protein
MTVCRRQQLINHSGGINVLVSHHSSPDRAVLPKLLPMAAGAIAAHHPVPKGLLKTAVSDGSITIFVTGSLLNRSAIEPLRAELDFAMSVCRGIVTVDLADCTELGAEATHVLQARHNAARAPEFRCQVRIVVGRSSIVRDLAAEGVPLDHNARPHHACSVPSLTTYGTRMESARS